MLSLASLILITVSAVDNGRNQFPPISAVDDAYLQSVSQEPSVRSRTTISGSPVTRRLRIFESFAKSEDPTQDDYPLPIGSDQVILASDDDPTINEILDESLVELRGIIEALTPVTGFQSTESLIVFHSLLGMFSSRHPVQFHSPLPWQTYLSQSITNLRCSVTDLCREFGSNFKCDQEGHLRVILLNGKGPFDHLNLLMIPNTVEILSMERCGLTSISAWSDLKDKSLQSLRIYETGTSNLKLNLDGLQGTLDYLPLRDITVARA